MLASPVCLGKALVKAPCPGPARADIIVRLKDGAPARRR